MCTTCATPAAVAARITRRVPSTFTRRSCSGCRPGCSAQARWTTASAPSRNRARTCSLAASPRSARCHRTSRYGATSGGCRRARPRISFTPFGSALSRRSSAVPTLPVAPVMATVRPGRWELGSSAMLLQLPVPSAGNRCRRPRAGRRLRPVIRGAHVILYSSDAEADRALLADLLDLPAVDAGGGWLILQLPPAEVAVHPAQTPGGGGALPGLRRHRGDRRRSRETRRGRRGADQRSAMGPAGHRPPARWWPARVLRAPSRHGVRPLNPVAVEGRFHGGRRLRRNLQPERD